MPIVRVGARLLYNYLVKGGVRCFSTAAARSTAK